MEKTKNNGNTRYLDAYLASLVYLGPKVIISALTTISLHLLGIEASLYREEGKCQKDVINKLSLFKDTCSKLEILLGKGTVIDKKVRPRERIMVISDTHDNYDVFRHHTKKQKLKEKLLNKNEPFSLFILGDLGSGEWPPEFYKGKRVIKWINETKEQLKKYNLDDRLVVIRGNHDEEAIKNYEASKNESIINKFKTLVNKIRFASLDKEEYSLLKNSPYALVLRQKNGKPIVFTHANLPNGSTMDKKKNRILTLWSKKGNIEMINAVGAGLLINGHQSPIDSIAFGGRFDRKKKIATFGKNKERVIIQPYKFNGGGGNCIMLYPDEKTYNSADDLELGKELLPVY